MKMKRESDDKPIMFDLLLSLVLLDMLESEVRRAIIFFYFLTCPHKRGRKIHRLYRKSCALNMKVAHRL
jgi:hypothetical protein